MRRPAITSLVLALVFGIAPAANAERLWSEKPPQSPLLAQVPDFAALAAQVNPAVVSIVVEQKGKLVRYPNEQPNPFNSPGNPFFRFFGPMPEMPGPERQGLGSGFFIHPDGLVLTNYHVVENAERIEVTQTKSDGSERTFTAKVVGSAPEYDVALVKTDEVAGAPVTSLGDSDALQIGDWVMAIGDPFGLSHSVSVGIISAKGRREIVPSGRQGLYNFLQTDASINPGNSGGPLVNMRGEVVGINTAINASGQGIGFAIPINMVKTMIPQLKESGRFSRSWIGVKVQPLSDELAQSYGLKQPRGALVSEVVPGGPGERAGLKEGDIVLEFDGQAVRDSSDLPLMAGMFGTGKKAPLKIWRDGKEKPLSIELGEFPQDEMTLAAGNNVDPSAGLGMAVSDITPQIQQQLRLEVPNGVVVRKIEPGGPAARGGLRPGDVVVGMDGEPVKSARQFLDAAKAIPKGRVLRLKLSREGKSFFVGLRKP